MSDQRIASAVEPAVMMETAVVIEAGLVADVERRDTIEWRDAIDVRRDEDAVAVVMMEASPVTGLRRSRYGEGAEDGGRKQSLEHHGVLLGCRSTMAPADPARL